MGSGTVEFFRLFKPFTQRHLEGRKRAPRFRVPIRARFWREWADQRASRPERPCVYLPNKRSLAPIRALCPFTRKNGAQMGTRLRALIDGISG